MKKVFLFASIAAACTLTACDKDDDNDLNSTDRTFMSGAAMSNKAEIMAGQLAASKGSMASVRNFGQMMVMEHGTAHTELQTVATNTGYTLPDSVDAEHQALMMRLNTLTGYSFDTAYMNSQVKDHQKTLDMFNMEQNNGSRNEVQDYADKYKPHIQMHYNMADSIRKTL